jgi:hypothetical protein
MESEIGVTELTDESVPTRVVGAVQAEVDGELILLSPKDFSYFGAAGTGGPVWELVDGTRSLGQIVATLESQYEAEPGVIRAETIEFIDALRAAGLVEFAS